MKKLKRLIDTYAPYLLSWIWLTGVFALSIGVAVWAIRWIMRMVGVI